MLFDTFIACELIHQVVASRLAMKHHAKECAGKLAGKSSVGCAIVVLTPNASASRFAGSIVNTSTLEPMVAAFIPIAADTVVLPTHPSHGDNHRALLNEILYAHGVYFSNISERICSVRPSNGNRRCFSMTNVGTQDL